MLTIYTVFETAPMHSAPLLQDDACLVTTPSTLNPKTLNPETEALNPKLLSTSEVLLGHVADHGVAGPDRRSAGRECHIFLRA